jgi:Bacterial Ig-like domain
MLVALLAACASQQAPPGGPEDRQPPVVLSVSPESGSTNAQIKSMEFIFDEVVSDRPTSAAAQLDQLFLISPYDGTPRLSWHRNRIDVRPRKGFRANTAYSVTILPGLADLRGNVRKAKQTVLISTGPTFPAFGILGRVFDWTGERPAVNAWVEAVSHPDSVRYIAFTDSVGQFDIGPLPAGDYTVTGLIDQNNNRAIDRLEKWDSIPVKVENVRRSIELDAIERDSAPPALIAAPQVVDSVTLRIDFDKYIDPLLPLQPALVRVQRADSTALEVARVVTRAEFDQRQRAIEQARIDSVRRADSVSAAARARAAPPAAAPPAAPPAAAPTTPVRPTPPPPPKPRNPAPVRGFVVILSPSTPLRPEQTYRVTTRGIRNLLGRSETMTATFTVPKPPPPGAPTDTAAKPPAAPPPAARPPGARQIPPAR